MDEKKDVFGSASEIKTEVVPHFFVAVKMKDSNWGWFVVSNCVIDHRDRECVVRNAEASRSKDYDFMVIETLLPVRL